MIDLSREHHWIERRLNPEVWHTGLPYQGWMVIFIFITVAWHERIKSPATQLFVQQLVQADKGIKTRAASVTLCERKPPIIVVSLHKEPIMRQVFTCRDFVMCSFCNVHVQVQVLYWHIYVSDTNDRKYNIQIYSVSVITEVTWIPWSKMPIEQETISGIWAPDFKSGIMCYNKV